MEELREIKFFGNPDGSGRLNADDAPFSLAPNEWLNLENCRTGSTDKGVINTIESIGSTLLISSPQPSVTFMELGTAQDSVGNRTLRFLFNTTGTHHKITSIENGVEIDCLLSTQVTGGLNFSKDYPIHSARVIDGLLYWTDNINQIRKINIDAALKLNNPSYDTEVEAYTNPVAPIVITVLRPPPTNPLTVSKVTQTSPALENNFVKDYAFQFAARYYYRDGETSVPSCASLLAPYNIKADTFNRIDVVVPVTEFIEQDVQRMDILVKYGNENTYYRVKSWDKDIPSQSQEIADHNAGTSPLTYNFYNDTVGEALDEASSLKPFDSVPITSETLELFGNRLGVGNNLEGYSTPITTSLNATPLNQTQGATPTGSWVIIRYGSGATHYFIDLGELGFFDSFVQPPPFPSSVVYGTLTLVAAGPASFALYVVAHYPMWTNGIEYTGDTSTITGAPADTTLVGARCFKTGAFYKLATTFYDFGDRKCGITGAKYISGIPMTQAVVQIPNRSYDTVTYVTAINWTLSNADAINEIPDWATHYSVDITKCLTTRFFLQARSKNSLSSMAYVNRDADNEFTFSTSAYSSTLVGVGVDITNLQNFGMGYVFSEGDLIKIYISGNSTVFNLSVLAQDGRWLICELQDLGTLNATTDALFELYTPFIQSINEPYFEVANIFPIDNAGTTSRAYSNLAGSIRGDVTLLDRGTSPSNYLTENMSPNDKYYFNWYTDAGRPNFVDRVGQQQKLTNISYSNVWISGTKNNGLSSFDALDEKNLPAQCGSIQKLQVTSKVQNELGIVMLALCELETVSIYIEEVQLYGSNAPSTLAQAPNVIGTINILKGNYGTSQPTAVVEYRGNVFFPSEINGKWIQYSQNGLFPISSYKMTRFWGQWFKQYLSMTAAEIEALGSRPFLFSTVDPYHGELLISIPKLSNNPPKGYLPDYPSTIYPFDILDFQAKTIVYQLDKGTGKPKWMGSYSFAPEGLSVLQNNLYSSKNGLYYLHNQTSTTNVFYGIKYRSKIMFVSNGNAATPKIYNNNAVEVNMTPFFVYLYNDYPIQQSSDLVDNDFTEKEGIWYSKFLRNKLVPTATGYTTDGLLTGEKMRNVAMYIMLEFSPTTTFLELKFYRVGYQLSIGSSFQPQ